MGLAGRKQAIPGVESIIISLFGLLLLEHLCTNHCDIDPEDITVNKTVLNPESLQSNGVAHCKQKSK